MAALLVYASNPQSTSHMWRVDPNTTNVRTNVHNRIRQRMIEKKAIKKPCMIDLGILASWFQINTRTKKQHKLKCLPPLWMKHHDIPEFPFVSKIAFSLMNHDFLFVYTYTDS